METHQKGNRLSRRDFMGLSCGAAGLAFLNSMGMSLNNATVKADSMKNGTDQIDVLVVGSGMAGLFAAVKAHDAGASVLLVSKGRLGTSGQTPFAKGIFAYDSLKEDLSLDDFVSAVGRSALGTNNPVYTRQMAAQSLYRVKELKEWGFFDSPLCNKSFNKPILERKIKLKERIVITHLIKENQRIAGAAGFGLDDEKVHFFNAKSVILCTGAGGFKPNGFPICDLTHDGSVMAYKIGAKITGKEWNDGHPGQVENAAACYDGWHGMFDRSPGVTGVSIRHDLGIDLNYMAYMGGNPVQMMRPGSGAGNNLQGGPYRPQEFSHAERPQGGHRPPPRDRNQSGSKENGEPPGMRGISVGGSSAGMAIHKSEGLVPINENCESNIPGLYAAGDALGSYMAGAIYTQIGSSLAGSAVQGAIAGETAAVYSKNITQPVISKAKQKSVRTEILAPLNRKAGYGPAWVTQTLQGIMIPNFILYIKKENLLKAALAYIEELRDHHVPLLRAADIHELRLAHETENMIVNAEMKLRASIMRKESRCSHYRLDYPDLDEKNWRAWINIFRGSDGLMKLEKQAFGEWPGTG